MKRFFMLMAGAMVIAAATSTSVHSQKQLTISGKSTIGSVLNASISVADVEKVEWKYNGKVISTSGSSRKGVTVAGGHCQGNNANQLNNPNGVFVDKDDNIWVADASNGRVQKFTPGNPNAVTFGAELPNSPSFPTNIFVADNGSVYVADYFEGKVKLLVKDGTEWINVAGQNNELDLVRGVWVDEKGNVYCTQYGFFFNGTFELDGMILKYPPNSSAFEIVAGHNGTGSALNQFSMPVSVMLDDDGNIIVADGSNDHGLQNARVMKWAPGATEGEIVAGGNGEGEAANQCPSPVHAFVDKKGNIYVSNFVSFKVTKWKPGATTGEIVAGGNGMGDNPDQLNFPFGIFVKKKYMYVVDVANHRVQKFDLNEPNKPNPFKARHPGDYTALATLANGSVIESNTITVSDNKHPGVSSLINHKTVAFPNPANNVVTINYYAAINGQAIFELTDLTGRLLLRKEANAIKGNNLTGIDLNPFVKGTYIINILKPGKTKESIKVVRN